MTMGTTTKCCICGLKLDDTNLFPLLLLKNEVYELIKIKQPKVTNNDFICFKDLHHYKLKKILKILPQAKISEEKVINSVKNQEFLSKDIHHTYHEKRTFGEKLADKVATFGGSWSFIINFTLFIIVWIIFNSYKVLHNPFDPFPYILLNLILSCLAALQAPIIMMSQNRQEAKDRLRATHDYEVNLKAELEIRMLNSKLDDYIQTSLQQIKHLEEQQEKLLKTLVK